VGSKTPLDGAHEAEAASLARWLNARGASTASERGDAESTDLWTKAPKGRFQSGPFLSVKDDLIDRTTWGTPDEPSKGRFSSNTSHPTSTSQRRMLPLDHEHMFD
jgi:hypothetical protein